MASKRGSVKVAYDLDPDVKMALSVLKAQLRRKGIPATETGIIEILVKATSLDRLSKAYRGLER